MAQPTLSIHNTAAPGMVFPQSRWCESANICLCDSHSQSYDWSSLHEWLTHSGSKYENSTNICKAKGLLVFVLRYFPLGLRDSNVSSCGTFLVLTIQPLDFWLVFSLSTQIGKYLRVLSVIPLRSLNVCEQIRIFYFIYENEISKNWKA